MAEGLSIYKNVTRHLAGQNTYSPTGAVGEHELVGANFWQCHFMARTLCNTLAAMGRKMVLSSVLGVSMQLFKIKSATILQNRSKSLEITCLGGCRAYPDRGLIGKIRLKSG